MPRPLKVLHIATGTGRGGAEIMLARLLGSSDREAFESRVISLQPVADVGEQIRAAGFDVWSPGLVRRAPNPLALVSLVRAMRAAAPDVIQTWMHDADLIGGLCARFLPRVPVAWGLHQGVFDLTAPGQRRVYYTARACARLSRFLPARIVCCSETSRRVHGDLGYQREKMQVINNGFDTSVYRPDPEARASVRRELGLPEGALLVGQVGRFHPQKDHRNFIEAAKHLSARRGDVHFLLCGQDLDDKNESLSTWLGDSPSLRARTHFLGRRDDTARIVAAFDLASSSSAFGEAFPLVLGEAMAAGVPCVTTDVGDSAILVGDTGRVVPPRDAAALADAWNSVLSLDAPARRALGQRTRDRVQAHYALPTIARRYGDLYRELAEQNAR